MEFHSSWISNVFSSSHINKEPLMVAQLLLVSFCFISHHPEGD